MVISNGIIKNAVVSVADFAQLEQYWMLTHAGLYLMHSIFFSFYNIMYISDVLQRRNNADF